MELDSMHFSSNWADHTFATLNGIEPSSEKWPTFSSSMDQAFPPSTFTLPTLMSEASIERYGQITPPEELSRSPAVVSASQQQRKELGWPNEQQLQDLASFDPTSPPRQRQSPASHSQATSPEPPRNTRRRRTATKEQPANQSTPAPTTAASQQPRPQASRDPPHPQSQPQSQPQPPKRKRGRPKSQPQPQDAISADGYPFPVSSARESHLEKNRVAAHKCRQRRKEYINGLETRARDLTSQNRVLRENVAVLREDVLRLKNIMLEHAGCGCWAVDQYLARCAGDLLGVQNPFLGPQSASPVPKDEHASDMSSRATAGLSTPGSQAHDFDDVLDLINDEDMDGSSNG